MSVTDIPTRKLYDCDGAAKNYPILFQYLAESNVTVKHIDSAGAITTLILDDVGANGFVITSDEVVTNTLYPNTDQIWLIRETPRTQGSVRKNNRRTPASVDDGSYDKLTMIVQEMEDTQERTLALADTTPTDVSVEIPAPVARRVPIWDATGKFLEYTTYDPDTQQSGAAASAAAALVSENNAEDSAVAAAASAVDAAAAAATVINMKVIDIGDWDMDGNAGVTITHGLDLSKIRSVAVVVRNDADNGYYDLSDTSDVSGNVNGGVVSIGTTGVGLARKTGGFFDSTDFDSLTYNRGWITIWYTD